LKIIAGRFRMTANPDTIRVQHLAAFLVLGRHCYYIGIAPKKG